MLGSVSRGQKHRFPKTPFSPLLFGGVCPFSKDLGVPRRENLAFVGGSLAFLRKKKGLEGHLTKTFQKTFRYLWRSYSLLFRGFFVVFFRGFFVALFCLEKQCSGLFRYFFVAFSWPPFWANFTRTRPGTVFWNLAFWYTPIRFDTPLGFADSVRLRDNLLETSPEKPTLSCSSFSEFSAFFALQTSADPLLLCERTLSIFWGYF